MHTITESMFRERSIVLGKIYFCTISPWQLVQELNKTPDIHQTGYLYFSSLHVTSEKKPPQAYPLPDACFLKLLQHFRASCSGASTSDHILWFQVKPYITTMAFPQFPHLSCLGLFYHKFYINNPSYFSISWSELSYKENEKHKTGL